MCFHSRKNSFLFLKMENRICLGMFSKRIIKTRVLKTICNVFYNKNLFKNSKHWQPIFYIFKYFLKVILIYNTLFLIILQKRDSKKKQFLKTIYNVSITKIYLKTRKVDNPFFIFSNILKKTLIHYTIFLIIFHIQIIIFKTTQNK